MAMTLCAAGKHYYDSAIQADCPYCGDSGFSGSPYSVATPALANERTQMLTADSQGLAAQSAKTQILDNTATEASSAPALKTHIIGMSNQPDAEARAKGMCEFPVVGWLVITEGQGRGTDFRLIQGENRIGRNADLEVCLDFGAQSDNTVSHEALAVVVYDHHANEFFIERGSSRNLAMLNGSTIRGEPTLQCNDIIQVGTTKLLFLPFCDHSFKWQAD